MARYGGSISMRLTLGFVVVLAVFGTALLISLYHLDAGRRATEEIRIRQGIRREARQIAEAAEELFFHQGEFVASDPVDFSKQLDFENVYSRIDRMLRSLRSQPVESQEQIYLDELMDSVTQLRTLFLDGIVPAKIHAGEGSESAMALDTLEEESREKINRINHLNTLLADVFEARTLRAESQASGAWDVSIAMAQVIVPVALLICLLVVYYTHRSISRPIGALVKGTQALARGRLGESIDVQGSGEFSELAESFNDMARALDTNQKRLVEAEKLASVGRLAAGLAHEINNPVAVILGYAQMLMASMPEGSPEREQVQTIAQEARQCKSIVDGLLDLSRPTGSLPGETIDPSEVLAEIINVAHALQLTGSVEIAESVICRPLPLTVSHPQLRQLMLNIVRNALEAMQNQENGRLRIDGYVRPRAKLQAALLEDASSDAKSFLVLIFTDNGPGIPKEDLRALFEPFFTTKAEGVGLGLAISYNIARSHGGFIKVQSTVGEGTTFSVGLPLSDETAVFD